MLNTNGTDLPITGGKYLCKNIYVIANEVKQSQTPAIATLREAPFGVYIPLRSIRNDIVYLILHDYIQVHLLVRERR